MTVLETLRESERHLRQHRVGSPGLTARLLLADELNRSQAWLVAHSDDQVNPHRLKAYRETVAQRSEGVPTQYLRGKQEFYGLEFRVTPDVLIPRPETEHLVEAALERIQPGDQVVDIGTGSGAVAVTLAKHRTDVLVAASDISVKAVRVALSNSLSLGARVNFCAGDLCDPFRSARFDIIVSNPPYVPLRHATGLQREVRYEPSVALYGGEHGHRFVRRIAREAPRILKPDGWLLMEIGFGSRAAVERFLDRPEWTEPQFLPDLAGIDRVVAVRRWPDGGQA